MPSGRSGLRRLPARPTGSDDWVLAGSIRRDLILEIRLPDPDVRTEWERGRFRVHLVHKRTPLRSWSRLTK